MLKSTVFTEQVQYVLLYVSGIISGDRRKANAKIENVSTLTDVMFFAKATNRWLSSEEIYECSEAVLHFYMSLRRGLTAILNYLFKDSWVANSLEESEFPSRAQVLLLTSF